MLSKKYRLNNQKSISYLLRRGNRFRGRYMDIFFSEDKYGHFHLAIMVSKKNVKNAVSRNLVRRRIKAMIKEKNYTDISYNIVVIMKKNSEKATYSELLQDMNIKFK